MQPRLAKRIVQRVLTGTANHTSYTIDQVINAFSVMKEPLSEAFLVPWRRKSTPVLSADELAARQDANRARREASLEAMAVRREARAERKQALEAAANHVVTMEASADGLQDLAVAAAREAFNRTMQQGAPPAIEITTPGEPSCPDDCTTVATIELEDSILPPEAWASLTVNRLREIARDRGLSGYSTMKKDALIALLTGG